jgi:enoyl-CoA hydratase/carnithine racemase
MVSQAATMDDGSILRGRPARGIASIGIDRVNKRNAFTPHMLDELARAYTEAEDDDEVRVILLHGRGGHFTSGLDLPRMVDDGRIGRPLFNPGGIDPVGLFGRIRTKPVVVATEGICFTLGVELILASDIAVAAEDSRFGQLEVQRSLMPYAGATIRMVERFGWGNAMRYLLTGDIFDAAAGHRLGLVQEIVAPGAAFEATLAIAKRVAAAAPLAVRATLANAMLGASAGPRAAIADLLPRASALAGTRDAAEAVAAFLGKRTPLFTGD